MSEHSAAGFKNTRSNVFFSSNCWRSYWVKTTCDLWRSGCVSLFDQSALSSLSFPPLPFLLTFSNVFFFFSLISGVFFSANRLKCIFIGSLPPSWFPFLFLPVFLSSVLGSLEFKAVREKWEEDKWKEWIMLCWSVVHTHFICLCVLWLVWT